MMSKRRAEEDENEAPTAKARRSNQASTSKKARNGVDSAGGRSQGAQVSMNQRSTQHALAVSVVVGIVVLAVHQSLVALSLPALMFTCKHCAGCAG